MRRPALALLATSLAGFVATLDNTVVAVALRDVQADLTSGVTGLQGVVTAYTVALAALLLAGGALVDQLGAKRVLLAGLVVFGAASAACAGAGSVTTLVALRAVQGAGAALLLPGGLAVLAAAYPDGTRRRRALGLWAATGALALVAGPAVGGELVARYGWPSVFWLNVPLCAVVAGLVLLTPRTPPPHRRRLDLPGTALTVLALGAASYAVVVMGRHGLTATALAWLLVAVLAGSALVAVERRSTDPLLPAALLRDRHFSGAALAAFGAALAVFLLLVFLSLYLQLVQDHDARSTGRVLLPLPLALVVTAPLAGRWHAVARPVALGLLLAGSGVLALALTLRVNTSAHALEGWLALIGAGVGLTTAPVVSSALAAAGQARAGLAAGSINVARELGGVAAVAGLGALAVARLSARLTSTLTALQVPTGKRPALLDAMLSGRTDQARRLLLQDVGVERALRDAARLTTQASASFVSSTRVALAGGGVVLLLLAAASAYLLRPVSAPTPRARAPRPS